MILQKVFIFWIIYKRKVDSLILILEKYKISSDASEKKMYESLREGSPELNKYSSSNITNRTILI